MLIYVVIIFIFGRLSRFLKTLLLKSPLGVMLTKGLLSPFQKDLHSRKKICFKIIHFLFLMYYLMKNCKFLKN